MTRPGIEPATSRSQSGRSTTEPLCRYYFLLNITKTCLYNFDPLKPHLYIKLGFTGVYIIFLISAQQKSKKYWSYLYENFQFLQMKFSIYLNRYVFVMEKKSALSRAMLMLNVYHSMCKFSRGQTDCILSSFSHKIRIEISSKWFYGPVNLTESCQAWSLPSHTFMGQA